MCLSEIAENIRKIKEFSIKSATRMTAQMFLKTFRIFSTVKFCAVIDERQKKQSKLIYMHLDDFWIMSALSKLIMLYNVSQFKKKTNNKQRSL